MQIKYIVSIIDEDDSRWSRTFDWRNEALIFANANKYSNITINQ